MLIAQARLAEIAERLDKIMGPVISGDEYNQLVDQAAAAAIEKRQFVAVDPPVLLSESDEVPVAFNGAPNPCRSVAKPISDKDLAILQKNPEYIIGLELHLLMQHGHSSGFNRDIINRIGINLGMAD
ncbi:hypothetical protein CKM354_000979400 [Cercospora kikuchii]|uniref:Uncharacterized protein n=1 Tax=Cercospora kikuchii TaxID=84275 RepID=A0A9P3CQ76_9PEZI|nr:uncharacterized protein CKM354_000979400 [Cercospora kikuchii]GIZ46676.1 hypothetical protein CKM354_000979400 [Cercospora kikuchii]